MSVFNKILDAMKFSDGYDEEEDFFDDEDFLEDEEEEDFFDDEEIDEKPKKKFFEKFGKKKDVTEDLADDFEEDVNIAPKQPQKSVVKTEKLPRQNNANQSSKIMPMRSSKKASSQSVSMEVCVIKPTSMEDAREIADTLQDNSTVILNLEGIDMELAQRIIDFTSGACYSLGGSLQKVSSYIFVIGPFNVDITGDLQNILGGSTPSVRAGY